jgi:hypothetical protein
VAVDEQVEALDVGHPLVLQPRRQRRGRRVRCLLLGFAIRSCWGSLATGSGSERREVPEAGRYALSRMRRSSLRAGEPREGLPCAHPMLLREGDMNEAGRGRDEHINIARDKPCAPQAALPVRRVLRYVQRKLRCPSTTAQFQVS